MMHPWGSPSPRTPFASVLLLATPISRPLNITPLIITPRILMYHHSVLPAAPRPATLSRVGTAPADSSSSTPGGAKQVRLAFWVGGCILMLLRTYDGMHVI